MGQVLPISKPPHVRSKKPLKRIEVTEVGDFDFEKEESGTASQPEAEAVATAVQSDVEKEISERLESSAKIGAGGDDEAALVKPKTAVQGGYSMLGWPH